MPVGIQPSVGYHTYSVRHSQSHGIPNCLSYLKLCFQGIVAASTMPAHLVCMSDSSAKPALGQDSVNLPVEEAAGRHGLGTLLQGD